MHGSLSDCWFRGAAVLLRPVAIFRFQLLITDNRKRLQQETVSIAGGASC